VIDMLIGLRVKRDVEVEGLDINPRRNRHA
jgi:hypothetical protein